MNNPTHPERFHALDATRAFALLLGIVFHAAWSFVPSTMGAPIVDVKASGAFDWFFFTSHTFRMQLFFLIAGFFAHLVCHRRGFASFAQNRLLRIAVPMVIGWFLFIPLLKLIWVAGGNLSGRHLEPLSLTTALTLMFQQGLLFTTVKSGGWFTMLHLWFLYYLLCLYVVVLGIRFLVTRWAAAAQRCCGLADNLMRYLMQKPLAIVWLAVGTGLLLWPMDVWFGVETAMFSLVPSIPVLVHYGFFFAFGWILHRQAKLLPPTARHWRWQISLGLVLSFPLFLSFKAAREHGWLTPHPRFTTTQVTNWPQFLGRLQKASEPTDTPDKLHHLWSHLPPAAQARILATTDAAAPDGRACIVTAISGLLRQAAMFRPEAIPAGSKPAKSEALKNGVANRATLTEVFDGAVAGDRASHAWYQPAKLAYSIGYGLVLWLLLFGTVGFFQARCAAPSSAWRYLADSSYWLYLAHLPLVCAMQVWMAEWPMPGIVKFLLLNSVAFTILLASYHWLVRSTFIGRTLNGRAHPFYWNPWRALCPEPGHAQPTPKTVSPAMVPDRSRP